MANLNTYNILISRFEKFADGHYLINDFSHGEQADKDLLKEQRYPYMHVVMNNANYPTNEAEWSWSILFIDLTRDKTEKIDNSKNVLSDMIQIAEDLLSEMINGGNLFGIDCEVTPGATLTPLIQWGEQAGTGVRLDFSFRFTFDFDSCDIPADYVAISDGTTRGQSVRLSAIPVYEDGVFIGNATALDFTNGATLSIDGDGKVFIDITGGGGGGTQNLQQVTDEGNTTTNDIQLINDAEVIFGAGGGVLLDNGSRLREGTIDAGTGGSKGISQICGVGYELKWEAGSQYVMNGNGDQIREVNHKFNITPAVTDDSSNGFYVGSRWILDNGDIYICTDASIGAATWELQTATIPTLQQVTDAGNTSTNDLIVQGANNFFGQVSSQSIVSYNDVTGAYGEISVDTSAKLTLSDGTSAGIITINNLDNSNVQLEFPDKATGTYTIATTADIPAAQVNSDWNSTSGASEILNKPSIPASQVQSDWNASTGLGVILNKPSLATVATSGSYTDLTNKPTIPAAQIQSDWTQASTSALDYIKNKPTLPATVGDMTKAVYDTDNDGIVDFAEALKTEVRNSTGATLNKGYIVYLSGSTGNLPNAVLARANAEATSAQTFGVVLEDIANNSNGYVVTIGQINTLDTRTTATNPFTTDTLVDGQVIYLSPTTAGHITNVKPSAPNHVVYVGYVIRTSPTNGTIQYRIQNGYELDEIHDVAISSVANDQALVYESATSLWKNKDFSAITAFLSAVRGTALTGLSTSSPALVTATDTILQAIGKLQAQVVTPIKANTLITHTGTTAETIIFSSNNLNGLFAANDFFEQKLYIGGTLNTNNKIMKVYFGPNSNNLTSAVQFGTYNLNSTTARFQAYQRVIQFQNSLSSQLIVNSTTNLLNQDTTFTVATETKTNNFASAIYMHVTVALGVGTDSFFLYGIKTDITR
jgi:hypothetical protein